MRLFLIITLVCLGAVACGRVGKHRPPEAVTPPREPVALALLIDKSEAMGADGRLDAAKGAVLTLLERLRDEEEVALIIYDTTPFLLLPLEPLAGRRPQAPERLALAEAGGGTLLLPALGVAIREMHKARAAQKEIVLVTMGGLIPFERQYLDMAMQQIEELGAKLTVVLLSPEAKDAFAALEGRAVVRVAAQDELPQMLLNIWGDSGKQTPAAPQPASFQG